MKLSNYLESEFAEPYAAWKASATPDTNANILKALEPVIQKGIQSYAVNDPIMAGKARMMALDALDRYDPQKSALQSYMLNSLKGLRRATVKQQNFVNVPERLLQDNMRLAAEEQRFLDETGRPPTDAELADEMRISPAKIAKIRRASGGYAVGQFGTAENDFDMPATRIPGQGRSASLWTQIVYDDLTPLDQKILEMSLGLNGQKKRSNQEIAQILRRSPSAISQRKIKIQQLLDREAELSPFLGD